MPARNPGDTSFLETLATYGVISGDGIVDKVEGTRGDGDGGGGRNNGGEVCIATLKWLPTYLKCYILITG